LSHAASIRYKDAVRVLLEDWGQPEVTDAELNAALDIAAAKGYTTVGVRLTKELHKLHPGHTECLYDSQPPFLAAAYLRAALSEWASDVSSFHEQRAAVRQREGDVVMEQQVLQQLTVAVAGMAKHRR
jgi:hypothetical protein